MSASRKIINRLSNSQPIHRRDYTKPDGRGLFLYGYKEHNLHVVEGENLAKATGSELRQHPLRGDWAVYAAKRQNRTFKPSDASNPLAPSKPGHPLTEIPFEGFELAVFENRFPSFDFSAKAPDASSLTKMAAKGSCEVVVYSPEASGSFATLGQQRRRLLLEAWIDRYQSLYGQGCAYVLPFENRGEEVGVTLHHPHGQIYGFPLVPAPQENALNAFRAGYDLASELKDWREQYWIEEAGGLVAYAPPFARFPYETWISGLTKIDGPWSFNEDQSDGFCHLLGSITARYDKFFGRDTPYMFSLHAAPYGENDVFQFSAQFYPLLRGPDRLKYLATVEQSTGIFTVDIMPEDTVKSLKGAL
jgi:UDPglucose--hexose-1-phosphate uridylyltransferase